MKDLVARELKRLSYLENIRQNFVPMWDDITRNVMPNHQRFNYRVTPGEQKDPFVVDSTARQAHQLHTSHLYTGLCNPTDRWFALTLQYPKQHKWSGNRWTIEDMMVRSDVRDYLTAVSERIYAAIQSPRSRFAVAAYEFLSSIAGYGTAIMFIGNEADSPIRYQTIPLRECFVACNSYGEINTVYRKLEYTALQAIEHFADDGHLSPLIYKMAEESPDQKIEFVYAVHPSDKRNHLGRAPNSYHKYYAGYFCCLDNSVVKEGGFRELPYVAARAFVNPGEDYGYSLATIGMPDIRMLQTIHWTTIDSAQRMAMATTLLPNDGSVRWDNEPGAVIAGGLTPQGTPKVSQLQQAGNLEANLAISEITRQQIKGAFGTDLIHQDPQSEKTATEIRQRALEYMRTYAAINARLEAEFAGPVIMRTLSILEEAGELPPRPEVIKNHSLKVDYLGPLSQTQKMVSAYVVGEYLQSVAPAIQMDPQSAMLRLNLDAIYTHNAQFFPLPPGVIRSDAEYKDKLAELKDAQQKAQAREEGMQNLNAAKEVMEMERDNAEVELGQAL